MNMQRALLKCYTIDSSVNIPFRPDQHHCSDEAKWRLGGSTCKKKLKNHRDILIGIGRFEFRLTANPRGKVEARSWSSVNGSSARTLSSKLHLSQAVWW